jgi:arabinosyltransferase B
VNRPRASAGSTPGLTGVDLLKRGSAGLSADAATGTPRELGLARWIAAIAGIVGFLLSAVTPLLPVVQTTATLSWPQGGQLSSVTAPLISQAPVAMTATVPCDVISLLPPSGGVVLGTAPRDGKQAALNGLFVSASAERVDVIDRNVVVASVTRDRVLSERCQRIEITSSEAGTFATFVGLTEAATGQDLRTGFADPNLRPTIVGVFTDLSGPAPPGLSLTATIDTRFSSTPTPIKRAAMLGGIVATVVALLALWRLDRADGRRMRRLIPTRWRTFSGVDAVVIVAFVVWHVIGAGSSDDGYQSQYARTAGHAGYMSNYHRWFGSPEDPFGWYYGVLAWMHNVSDVGIWMRLPDLICGLVCWLLISREVLPRMGPAVASSKSATWAAALVLLGAWMPFNNGLRPEGQIVTGALITYVLIERAVISRRLTPAALAIVAAAFTLGIQPTGLIAVAALLAGGRPILRIVARKRASTGLLPLLAPVAAAGFVVLTVVFADQTLASVIEATRIRTAIGPSQAWYTENLRYYYLILPTTDASIARRFGFLITMLCVLTTVFIMLRRKRIPGIARGPVWRLIGIFFATIFALMFTPTKWIHHFGLFAGIGAAMAALATVLVSRQVMRSPRNRMAFVAVVCLVLGLCFSSINGWWYVSNFGVPFGNSMPSIGGITISTIFFGLFALTAVWAACWHFAPERGESKVARVVTHAPIVAAAALMVVVFVGSMAVGVVRQFPSYSNGLANARSLAGGCGLADYVLVEPDPNAGFLTPLTGSAEPLRLVDGDLSTGFTSNGVPIHTVAESIWASQPMPGTDYDWDAPTALTTPGINGSTVPLPYGLDPARVPVVGSYTAGLQQQSQLTSAWYSLPPADKAHSLIVVTAAGTISGNSVAHGHTDGQRVELEYARLGADGTPTPAGRLVPDDIGPAPSWRNLRFARSDVPSDAIAVRVIAEDHSLNPGDWVAVTPPRAPVLRSVQQYIGSQQPVLLDWAVGFVFPCQRPMQHVNGVTEVPRYRISPDYRPKHNDTDTWQDGRNGGLLGITDLLLRAQVMPTYLSDDWGQDWGALRRLETVVDADPADITLGTATRSGLWSPGHIRIGA